MLSVSYTFCQPSSDFSCNWMPADKALPPAHLYIFLFSSSELSPSFLRVSEQSCTLGEPSANGGQVLQRVVLGGILHTCLSPMESINTCLSATLLCSHSTCSLTPAAVTTSHVNCLYPNPGLRPCSQGNSRQQLH